jgi:hypothetical protein
LQPLIERRKNMKKSIMFLSALTAFLLLAACATTQKAPVNEFTLNCGLLGDYCSKLEPGAKNQAGMRYINPAAQWTKYSKIMIDPVGFYGGSDSKVPAEDQQKLVDYFTQQLNVQLVKKFEIVQQAGPGVLKIQAALTDVSAATPGLRSVSMVVPQARVLGSLKYLATGTYPFVGGAQAEAKISDSETGEVLAAGVDRQLGGGSAKAGAQWEWGDAENAINYWCEMLTAKLSSWTSGTAPD